MVRTVVGLGLVIVALLIGRVADAAACDRAATPFEDRAVAVAIADAVVTAEVTAIDAGVATVTIGAVHKAPPGRALTGAAVAIRGVTAASADRHCGVHPIAVGDRYLFVLWAPTGAIAEFQLVDPMGGVADLAADTEATYQAAIAAAVAAPAATTATVAGGIASWLVIDPRGRGTGELDLVVIVRNVGARPRRWTYRSWPRAAQSRCALELVDAAGLQVPARPVPIAARDIRAYFAKHGPRYDLTLAPGDTAMLGLDRVTTAAPGWGYKERLGFVYYPPPAPGRYTIAARCTNLVGARGFGTAALAVTL
jgi:hypothetical protein